MSKGLILVVEDQADARKLLCTILKSLGFTTLDFGSGREALIGVTGKNIALCMLDVMMPEMNGFELLAELKKLRNFTNIPVIMVTAKDSDTDVLSGYQHGADYYITKPYTKQQIEYGVNTFIK